MENHEALALFAGAGALLTGHFKLSSGLHSDQYLEKFRLFEDPRTLDRLAADLAARFADDRIDVVLGPTTAGIILAYAVAFHLGVEARYAEREGDERRLRRGQVLEPGARVLVVDDILTTGGSIRECLGVLESHGAVLAGVGVLADRTGGDLTFGAPTRSVLCVKVAAFEPGLCPQCAAGAPLTAPGTRHLASAS